MAAAAGQRANGKRKRKKNNNCKGTNRSHTTPRITLKHNVAILAGRTWRFGIQQGPAWRPTDAKVLSPNSEIYPTRGRVFRWKFTPPEVNSSQRRIHGGGRGGRSPPPLDWGQKKFIVRPKTHTLQTPFCMPECAKNHLQQSRISKFSGGEPRTPSSRGGKGKGREWKGKGRREGKDREGGTGRDRGGEGKGGQGRGNSPRPLKIYLDWRRWLWLYLVSFLRY